MLAGQGAGSLGVARSCASRDLPAAFRTVPAAAGTHRARRAAGQVCGGLAEPLRLPPGEGRCCGRSRTARGEGRGGRDAPRSPPPSLPCRLVPWARAGARPSPGPRGWGGEGAGTPRASSAGHGRRLPQAGRKVASTVWERASWEICLKG